MTVTTVLSGVTGNYSLQAIGASGALVHGAAATLVIQDFTWTISPNSRAVASGGTGNYTIAAAGVNGFNTQLLFEWTPCSYPQPTPTVTVSTNSIQPNTTAPLSIGPFTGSPYGPIWACYNVCAYDGISHCAQALLEATMANDFYVAVSQPQTVTPPGYAAYTVTVSPFGAFNGTVGLSVSGLPPGASASFTNPSLMLTGSGPVTSGLNVTVPSGTPGGTYSLVVTATSGGTPYTATTSLVIPGSPGFTITTLPSPQNVGPNGTARYTIQTNASNGLTGSIALRTDATIDSHRSNRIIPGWQSRMSFEAKAANLL